ncbi:hypothetical protein H8959_018006 [Pygathrix nigripes]
MLVVIASEPTLALNSVSESIGTSELYVVAVCPCRYYQAVSLAVNVLEPKKMCPEVAGQEKKKSEKMEGKKESLVLTSLKFSQANPAKRLELCYSLGFLPVSLAIF